MNKHPRYHSAIHENAHCVVARRFGRMVVALDLETGSGEATLMFPDYKRTVESIRQSMTIAAAGPAAVQLFIAGEDDGGSSDRKALHRLAVELCGVKGSKAAIEKEIRAATQAAKKLIEEHREIIERLAASMIASYEIMRAVMPMQTVKSGTY